MGRGEETREIRLAIAAITACFAKALGDESEAFKASFDAALEEVADELKKAGGPALTSLFLLCETKDFLSYLHTAGSAA